jgi:hypothetical protein
MQDSFYLSQAAPPEPGMTLSKDAREGRAASEFGKWLR